jgi:ABC-type sugar transport system ATPase subunit
VLAVKNGIETFYGPIKAIRGVNLEVPAGHIVTVLGANGAGKTTILNTISGVLDPIKGSVEFEGQPIHGARTRTASPAAASCIGPEGRQVFPFLSVRENLTMGTSHAPAATTSWPDMERVLRMVPAPEGTPAPARRAAVRWRAADAGDRAGADGPADRTAARRALAGPVAAADARDLLDRAPHQHRARHLDPGRRAERRDRAADRRRRLHHGTRP